MCVMMFLQVTIIIIMQCTIIMIIGDIMSLVVLMMYLGYLDVFVMCLWNRYDKS